MSQTGIMSLSSFSPMLARKIWLKVIQADYPYASGLNDIYKEMTHDEAIFLYSTVAGRQMAAAVNENDAFPTDTILPGSQGWVRYKKYAAAVQITDEAYMFASKKLNGLAEYFMREFKKLDFSQKIRREYESVRPFILGTLPDPNKSGTTTPDKLPFFHNAHPTYGGTYSNIVPGTQMTQQGLIKLVRYIRTMRDNRGILLQLEAKRLIGGLSKEQELIRLFGSDRDPDNANNTVNVVKKAGYFSKGYTLTKYLDFDPNTFYVETNVTDKDETAGAVLITWRKDDMEEAPPSQNRTRTFNSTAFYTHALIDPRSMVAALSA